MYSDGVKLGRASGEGVTPPPLAILKNFKIFIFLIISMIFKNIFKNHLRSVFRPVSALWQIPVPNN